MKKRIVFARVSLATTALIVQSAAMIAERTIDSIQND